MTLRATPSAAGPVAGEEGRLPQLVVGLARACHPGPTVTVTAIVVSLALAAGQRWVVLPMAIAVFSGQLSVGWSNDVGDAHRDRIAGRLDKPIAAGTLPVGLAKMCIAAALLVCVVSSLAVGWLAGAVHLIAVAAGWAYNVVLKDSVFSVLPFAVAFAAVSSFVSLTLPGHPWPALWTALAGALLGSGAHFVNVLPDLERDVATGVHGLPQRIGAASSLAAGAVLMGASLLLITLAAPPNVGRSEALVVMAGAATLASMIIVAIAGAHRLAWRLAMVTAAVVTAAFVVSGASALV